MGIDPLQLRDYVVRPALAKLGLPGGLTAEMLVMGTAAQESGLQYIHQLGKGPALSLWQIEPSTATDALDRCPEAIQSTLFILGLPQPHTVDWEAWDRILPGNLYLSAAMCRLIYYLKPFKLKVDEEVTITRLARVWKLYYNTPQGAGTEVQFISNWRTHLSGVYEIEGE